MSAELTENGNIVKKYEKAREILRCIFTKKGPLNTTVYPNWIGSTDHFWYIKELKEERKAFRLVDAKAASNALAFDHQRLAGALADMAKEDVDGHKLPFAAIDLELEPRVVRFSAFEKRWQYDEAQGTCTELPELPGDREVTSPNGKWVVFAKGHNLWLRDVDKAEQRPLTSGGVEDYAYGATGSAWGVTHGNALQVCWSPDSQRIFTVQKDTRQVESLPIMHHVPKDGSTRPQVTFQKFSYPGEEHIETIRLLSIDIASGEQQAANYSQIPVTRNGHGFFDAKLGWWHKGSQLAYFVDVDRYYKYARLVEFDTTTGKTRILFEECSDTQINLMSNGDMLPSFMALPETNELLWYSERSGWAHLYLYDLDTGELKNTVTQGDWLVRDIVMVDPHRREVFVQTACRTPDRNAYYRDLVRVNIDTGELYTLASSDHDYFAGAYTDMHGIVSVGLRIELGQRGTSPSGNYSVVTRSRVNTLPESFVVDRNGEQILMLETTEIQGLPENWQWPEPVQVLAADGETDIYGAVFLPPDCSPDKSYPVISDTCNTPDFAYASMGAFENNLFEGMHYFICSALAELGFVVVQFNGRGISFRDKAFKAAGYGNLQLASMLEDQVAGIRQLAEQRPYMDMTRVGIYECEGGQACLQGMLDYPDFFKVGVTLAPHDSRLMAGSMWGDMLEGRQRREQAFPEDKAEQLRGKLLMMGGMLDPVTPPAGIFRMVEALIKANKDFDLVLPPNLAHDPSDFSYLCRRAFDYMVRHLLGEEPPEGFRFSGVFGD